MKANTKWITYRAMAAVLACAANVTLAQTPPTTVTNTFNINQPIPQGSANGLSDTQSFDFQSEPFSSITDLQVTLNISGGFTGDYYAYLVHDGGFAVLLNRAGRTSVNSVGYTDSGLNVTLSDSSPNDIHNYQSVLNPGGAVLTGTWAPDGRDMDPATVVETDNRTALLGSFIGADPSGQWTLYVTSLDFGEQGKLASWGLEVKGVPEPSSVALLIFGTVLIAARKRFCAVRASGEPPLRWAVRRLWISERGSWWRTVSASDGR